MNEVQRGQFSSLLRRYLGMTGTVDVASDLSPELNAGLTLESERPEWEFLKGAKLCGCAFNVGQDVANVSTHQIRNPATSGMIGIFAGLSISMNPGGELSTFRILTNTDLASNTPTIARDTRYPSVNPSSFIGTAGNQNPSGDVWWASILLASSPQFLEVPFVLTPGFALQVATIAINVKLRGAWYWLEKRFDDLEKATA